MKTSIWIAYTPYDGIETFSTEKGAREYVEEILLDDNGFWNSECVQGSWIGKIIKRATLNVTDKKEDHKCSFPNNTCSYRDDEGICIEDLPLDPDNPIYSPILGCEHPNFWACDSEEIGFFADLAFIDVKEN